MGSRGADSISGAGLQSHPKGYQESSKNSANDMLSVRISSKRRCLGGLGKNWEISEGRRAGRFLEEEHLV